jgi:uncharacterized protein YndB with AHSA1/START domain
MEGKAIVLIFCCLAIITLAIAACPQVVQDEGLPSDDDAVVEEKVQDEGQMEQEETNIGESAQTPSPLEKNPPVKDPFVSVDVYKPDKVWPGTTIFSDRHDAEQQRVVEVNMEGEIVWEFPLPKIMFGAGEVELLPDNRLLLASTRNGIFEIDRRGEIVWSYLTDKVSHDADRLPGGNTLFVWGHPDEINDAQVKEITPEGTIVWSWYARDHFYRVPYKDIYDSGWTHTNAVTRLPNGNTLISFRNFNFLVEVDREDNVMRTIGEGLLYSPHDPEVQPDGNILVISQETDKHQALELNPDTGEIHWRYAIPDRSNWPVRDVNRLPNGNTLITGSTKILEVTPGGEIVWRLLLNVDLEKGEGARYGFYKAERINPEK